VLISELSGQQYLLGMMRNLIDFDEGGGGGGNGGGEDTAIATHGHE
jgi:hypothetical protein